MRRMCMRRIRVMRVGAPLKGVRWSGAAQRRGGEQVRRYAELINSSPALRSAEINENPWGRVDLLISIFIVSFC